MSMDALRPAATIRRLAVPTLVATLILATPADAAVYRTSNFVVTAPSDSIARQVGKTAEKWRKRLALQWLGKEMPRWYKPCKVRVKVGQIGAGGATTFSFDRGHVFGWNMRVQGSLERILDSVVPHEVSHTIFASHFRRPLPRWADEGAATLVEHETEKRVQQERLKQAMKNGRQIPLRRLLPMKDYPRGMRQVLLLYAEGFSLADYLVQNGGRTRYLRFLEDAYRNGWDRALKRNYGVESVEDLEKIWKGWFMAGSPRLDVNRGEMVASKSKSSTSSRLSGVVVRSQTPPTPPAPPLAKGGMEELDLKSSPNAPDPKRGGRKHSTGTLRSVSPVSDGRRRTLNDGWVPIQRGTDSQSILQRGTDRQSVRHRRAGGFPAKDSAATASRGKTRPLPAGGARSPRDANSEWSSFPDRRSPVRP